MKPLLSLCLAALSPMLAAQDDRDRTTATGAIWMTGQSTSDLGNLVAAGWRFTDIEIESTTTPTFTVAAVMNSGSYAKAWWYAIGVTPTQLSASLSANNARLIDIEPYDDAGTTKFTALMISNTGADQKAWAWYYNQTSAQVGSNLTSNNGRLTCFRRYQTGGVDRWATVMIANTGADFRNWGYLYGASAATISLNLALNGNRIYGLERVGTDSYDVILMQANVSAWWYYFDQTAGAVTELLQQNLGRIADIERHSTLLGTRYNVVMLDNANALEQTARQEFLGAPTAARGDYGFFLKEVNGPVLAEMRTDTTFEPASTMKTVYHVHAMRRVALGLSNLSTLINKPLDCGVPGSNQTIELTLRQMMENSDNYSTLAISNHYGLSNINTTADALGMGSTNVNFTIGCSGPSPESTLTLRDLSTLHEAVANGYLLSRRDEFYDLMAESLSFPSWGTTDLDDKIDAEALVLGLPNAVRDAFKNELHLAYKPGGIGWTNPGVWTFYYAEGGWMSVPFKNAAGTITPKQYTFGVFNYKFTDIANEVPGRNAMSDAELSLVWDRVRAAMVTWDNHVNGQLTTLLGAGCAGSNGTPSHSASGTAEVGQSVTYQVQNAPANTFALPMFGFQNQTWNGSPLPVNLNIVGAPGCLVRIDPAVVFTTLTNGSGVGNFVVSFANDPSLIGAQLFSQFLVLDIAANPFGFTTSNAVRTTLGGWL